MIRQKFCTFAHIMQRLTVVGGIRIGTADVSVAPEAQNVGVVVDKNLIMSIRSAKMQALQSGRLVA